MRKQVKALYALIILTFIVMAMVIWTPFAKVWIKKTVAAQMAKYLEAPITFTDIQLGFFPPSVEFQNIQMIKQSSPLQYVSAGRIRVSMALSPSISGRIRIKKVEIEQPTLKFNFANFKFDRSEKKEEGDEKFRLPTLRDVLKVQIDQIEISKTALSFEFPGQYFVEMDSETAGYRREKRTEFWTWKGQAVARKGQARQMLDNVEIIAKREGQKVEIEKLEIAGVENHILLTGQAFPVAKMMLNISGETDDLMNVLRSMELMKGDLQLYGNYKIQSKLLGPWNDLNQDGKILLEKINLDGRKFDRLQADFQVRKNQIKSIKGALDVNQTKVNFDVNNILQNKKAQFTVRGENVNYGDVQRSIDPTIDPILRSMLNVNVQGEITIMPFTMKGKYKAAGAQMLFDFPPMLMPYIPLELKQIEAEGTVDWDMNKGCVLEGPVRTAGMNGTYKINFPEPAKVNGTWDFNISRFGELFAKDYPATGKGKITGALNVDDGDLRANFLLDIKDFQYAKYEKSTLTGDLIFTDKGTEVSKIQIATNNKRGIANFDGKFEHGEDGQTSVEGTAKNFNLAWISELVSRRFPFVAGIQGRGSATVSLHGPSDAIEGKVLFDSENFDWKNEHLDQVSARLQITPTGLDIQDMRFSAEQFQVTGRGGIVNDKYQGMTVKMTRVPVALIGMPSWLTSYVSQVDGDLFLDGALEDPSIVLTGKLYQPNAESTALSDAGVFSARGKASKLNWEIDAFQKSLRSTGTVQIGEKTILEATGEMTKFNVLPTTNSFMTGQWQFSGDLAQIKTWNGNFKVSDFEIRNNKFTYKTQAPFELTAQHGIFHLTPFKLGDKDSNVAIKGHSDVDQNLSFTMNGKMPIALLTLLPLKLNRAEGLADVDIVWSGTLTNPILNGSFHAKNAYVQTTLFPHAIEDLELIADIEQNRIKARSLKGKMADGVLEGRGDLYLPTSTEESRIFLTGTVDQAWLRFPEWLPVLISGNFILDGKLSKPLLKGDFTILEGLYKDEWDWKKQILTIGKTARTTRIYRKEEEGLQYDLAFRTTNGRFLLRNQIATATLRGDLRVMGTNENLGMLGQIEILEGEVVFLDRRFRLTPGVINFTNPNEIATSFDLNATINIENIDIYLDIRTEQDEIRAYLSSNPLKEETTIISLLTLGVELNDLAVAQSSDQGMSLSLLPSVLSGPVQSRVETGLRKIKLIDTFQFIPYFSEETKTTSMRLLVGKQLYSKIRLSYSTDLFDTGLDNIFALEHLLNNNVKLMGSVRDNRLEAEQDYDVGFDVEFRLDF